MSKLQKHFQGRYLGLVERDGWEYATRTNASAVAVIIAVTRQQELVLVEQHRIPVGCAVLELPAGLVGDHDDPDEAIRIAAQRELLEETGYRAGQWLQMLECPSSAGMCDETITFFLAQELVQEHAGGGDASEEIKVHTVPLANIDQWLAARLAEGILLDPKIYAALYWLGDPQRVKALAVTTPG
jgi:ADP-ribose pyrophosphatase